MSFIGIIVVIVGLLVSVAIHELAHMLPAKHFGVPVPAYSIGFGPVLWKRTVGETEYRLSAIPLGGYVKICGMYAVGDESVPQVNRRGNMTWAQEARRDSRLSIPAGREGDAFYLLAPWKKIVVMFSGPLSNVLLAALCFTVAFVGIGHPVATPTLSEVLPTVSTASGQVQSPALVQGLQAGDVIERIDGRVISQWQDVSVALQESAGGDAAIVVQRDGQELTVRVRPIRGVDGRWVIGVAPSFEMRSAPLSAVPLAMLDSVVGMGSALASFPLKVWEAGRSIVSGEPRSKDSAVSIVGAARAGGEITSLLSADTPVNALDDTRALRVAAALLSLVASINMALFAFNMVPLPPLDGGHIVVAVYEAARGWVLRRRGVLPRPVDNARLVPLTYGVGGLLFLSSLVLIVADIVNPLHLPV